MEQFWQYFSLLYKNLYSNISTSTYMKWRLAYASLCCIPVSFPLAGAACWTGGGASSPLLRAATGSSTGKWMFLSLHMLCSKAQASMILHTYGGGLTRISPWSTWNLLFHCPMLLSTMARVLLCALSCRNICYHLINCSVLVKSYKCL